MRWLPEGVRTAPLTDRHWSKSAWSSGRFCSEVSDWPVAVQLTSSSSRGRKDNSFEHDSAIGTLVVNLRNLSAPGQESNHGFPVRTGDPGRVPHAPATLAQAQRRTNLAPARELKQTSANTGRVPHARREIGHRRKPLRTRKPADQLHARRGSDSSGNDSSRNGYRVCPEACRFRATVCQITASTTIPIPGSQIPGSMKKRQKQAAEQPEHRNNPRV